MKQIKLVRGMKVLCDNCKNRFEVGITLAFYTESDIALCKPCAGKLGF